MTSASVQSDRPSRGRGQWSLRSALLLLLLVLCPPGWTWAQDEGHFAPGVKVLAALPSSVYDWSPAGQRLAYAADDGIWVVKTPDFQQPQRLIRKGRGEHHPITQLRWSPDGQKLAFVSSRPGDDWSTTWLTDAEGSQVRDLLPPGTGPGSPGRRAVEISAWLSDQELAYVAGCGNQCVFLFKIDVDSGRSHHLCTGGGGFSWAPTKERAVANYGPFSALSTGGLGLVEGRPPALGSSDFPASAERECSPKLGGCHGMGPNWQGQEVDFSDWSPDGKKVLYMDWACQKELLTKIGINLSLWEVDSGRQEQLVPNAGWGAWSPDGTKIAFVLFGEARYDDSRRIIGTDFVAGHPFQLSLGILEVATRAVPTLVPLGSTPVAPQGVAGELLGLTSHSFHPLWSPDSQHLVIQDSQKDLFLIRADGTGRRPLARGLELQASWSPDGKRLALRDPARSLPVKQNPGPERYLPPVGKDKAALSDAEIIEHYFEQILSKHREAPGTIGEYAYLAFLTAYAQALEELGKPEAAEQQYRQGIALIRSDKWQNKESEGSLNQFYAAFLCGQGRKEEAAQLGGCPSWWEGLQETKARQAAAEAPPRRSPWGGPPKIPTPGPLQSPSAEPPEVPPELPALYIVEVPEEQKQP